MGQEETTLDESNCNRDYDFYYQYFQNDDSAVSSLCDSGAEAMGICGSAVVQRLLSISCIAMCLLSDPPGLFREAVLTRQYSTASGEVQTLSVLDVYQSGANQWMLCREIHCTATETINLGSIY